MDNLFPKGFDPNDEPGTYSSRNGVHELLALAECRESFRWRLRLARIFVALVAMSVALYLAAAPALFVASSKAQGAPFDLEVTETHRFPSKSYLNVPGFLERTAAGSRWLMCAYTALAVQRGFSHFTVVYPPPGGIRIVVAFSNSPSVSPPQLLGTDYVKEWALGDRMMPVEKMAPLCGKPRR
jgi:hypothetical protein